MPNKDGFYGDFGGSFLPPELQDEFKHIEEAFYNGVCLVEWPEKMENLAPRNMWNVQLEHDENGRKITISTDDENRRLVGVSVGIKHINYGSVHVGRCLFCLPMHRYNLSDCVTSSRCVSFASSPVQGLFSLRAPAPCDHARRPSFFPACPCIFPFVRPAPIR